MLTESSIDIVTARRIEFLINEAKHLAKRDQAITYAMRVVSNIASIGSDAGSSKVKLDNRFVSAGAYSLLISGISAQTWTASTINEHPVPLKITWEWICEKSNSLNVTDVWDHFVKNRMITLLVSEDAQLTKMGLRSSSGAGDRYKISGLEVLELEKSPRCFLKKI